MFSILFTILILKDKMLAQAMIVAMMFDVIVGGGLLLLAVY